MCKQMLTYDVLVKLKFTYLPDLYLIYVWLKTYLSRFKKFPKSMPYFKQKISKTQKPIKAKIIIGKDTLKYLFKK